MPKLQVLKLEKCGIGFFEPLLLHGKLEHLSLMQNQLKDLNSIVFGERSGAYDLSGVELKTINLSGNQLTEFPYSALRLSEKLLKIDLSRNKISQISADVKFKTFERLMLLDLSSNNLSSFPTGIKDLTRLKYLRLI